MTLCLRGRFETRLFLLAAIALPWSLVVMVLYPPGGADLATATRSAATVVVVMAGLGLAWECLYHGLQQLRWDRDWPSLFALLCVLLEVGPLWLAISWMPGPTVYAGSAQAFLFLITTAWLLMWMFAQGPMRVVFIRWRLTGGRLL